MSLIEIKHKGNFKHTDNFFRKALGLDFASKLQKYGEAGVKALAESTPKDSGKTASCWSCSVEKTDGSYILSWNNSNINDNVNIAVILQYGHGTGTGGYVEGIDYINPALRPLFQQIADEAWREMIE